jgi:hypothetical protein
MTDDLRPESPMPAPPRRADYVVWSNEHRCWWRAGHSGYTTSLSEAGRYSRDEAMKICRGARGGRKFRDIPSEVPLLLEDAAEFWGEDRPEWELERRRRALERQRDTLREYGFAIEGEGDD